MAYDPKSPSSIFDGDNLFQFAIGLNNAYKLKAGLGGDVDRPDLGVCMVALEDASSLVRGE